MFLRARDESLMLAFKKGEPRAFEELMERHRSRVFNFLLRFVGDRAQAEDLSQETWMRVIRGAGSWQPEARFTTWLLTMARNLAVDSVRRERLRIATPLDALPHDPPSASADPEREAGDAELRRALEKAIAQLPEEQREVFTLREWGGVSFKEIGELAGISENTAKSRMRYALEGLRRSLMAQGFGERAHA